MYELDKEEMQVEMNFNKQDEEPWWSFEPLTYLDLSSNVIQEIPANIKLFEDLTVLNVSGLTFCSFFFFLLIMGYFQLQHNSLTTFPAEIGTLQKLTKLNASHNNIKILPNEFYKLTELQVLQLSHNCLESLTKDLGNFVMLHHLVMSIIILNVKKILIYSYRTFPITS